jgi:hypothetical protein
MSGSGCSRDLPFESKPEGTPVQNTQPRKSSQVFLDAVRLPGDAQSEHRGRDFGRYPPKSVAQWLEEIRSQTKGFIAIEREIFNSEAMRAAGPRGLLAFLTFLNKLRRAARKKKRRKGRSGGRGWVDEWETTEAHLTNNELKARGVGSDKTIARVRRALWRYGLLDVVRSGSFKEPGLFRLSERWKHYPNGDYKPKGQQKPGFCHYPENIRRHNARKKHL